MVAGGEERNQWSRSQHGSSSTRRCGVCHLADWNFERRRHFAGQESHADPCLPSAQRLRDYEPDPERKREVLAPARPGRLHPPRRSLPSTIIKLPRSNNPPSDHLRIISSTVAHQTCRTPIQRYAGAVRYWIIFLLAAVRLFAGPFTVATYNLEFYVDRPTLGTLPKSDDGKRII